MIHVPGLRDNPARVYRTTAVGARCPGTFDTYTASVIHAWQRAVGDRLGTLAAQLADLGLTDRIEAERLNDTQVEVRVVQAPIGRGGGRLINVADVGIGVSQVLLVLVARPGQLVYVEQPEIRLHPRAQTALADVLVAAANRGVRAVVETHSQLLLLALQTRIAEGAIAPAEAMLHWFARDPETGVSHVTSREPDAKGAYGTWPEDFSEVERRASNAYLDAAEMHLFSE
jgi:predicted ATPase